MFIYLKPSEVNIDIKFIFVSVNGCKLPYLAGKPKVFVFISFKYGD